MPVVKSASIEIDSLARLMQAEVEGDENLAMLIAMSALTE